LQRLTVGSEETMTRRIVMFNQVSADGYFATEDGGLDWVVQEPKVYEDATASGPSVDTMLFGRKTYENFESYWPHVLEQANPRDPHAPSRSIEHVRDMAKAINQSTKIVISKTRTSVTWNNSKLMHAFDPRAIEALKKQPGQDIMVFGSGSIVTQLTQHRLIDEYQFVVSPVLLGKGLRLLDGSDARQALKLSAAKSYESGVVVLRYGLK
jgi:dihydrofolate reductase